MTTMKELVLFGSSIAALLGRNPYVQRSEEIEKCLKKHDKELYDRLSFSFESQKKGLLNQHHDFFQTVKKESYRTRTVTDVSKGRVTVDSSTKPLVEQAASELQATMVSQKDITNRAEEKIQKALESSPELVSKIDPKMSTEAKLQALSDVPDLQPVCKEFEVIQQQKEEHELKVEQSKMIQQCAISMMNTSFGIRHEGHTLKNFCDQYHLPVETPKQVFKKTLYEDTELRIVLAGKVDGLIEEPCVNEKPCIVEIKNRVKAFFPNLVEYEKVQIMTYMFICEVDQCFLIQTLKDSSTCMSVDLYSFDESWFDTFLHDLVRFGKGYLSLTERIEEYKKCKTGIQKEELLKKIF